MVVPVFCIPATCVCLFMLVFGEGRGGDVVVYRIASHSTGRTQQRIAQDVHNCYLDKIIMSTSEYSSTSNANKTYDKKTLVTIQAVPCPEPSRSAKKCKKCKKIQKVAKNAKR